MPMTFDQYNFCSLGCLYCFAYFFKTNNPAISNSASVTSVKIQHMIDLMSGKHPDHLMYKHFYSKKFLLHWGGLGDPFCSFERTNWKGLKLIKYLGRANYPCLFSFKGSTIFHRKIMKVFEKWSKQRNFAFQVSIITADPEMAKRVEIGVPSPTKRFEALKILSDMGYWTILRLRPFIIGITDDTLDELLERALEAGVHGVSCEFFAMDCRSNEGMKTRYDWIGKLVGCRDAKGLHEYFAALSPSERGGYMRLNRDVKEPFVKKIYQFCAKHDLVCGISDPDFKELNTSGSCCAMPDKHPENPVLENWTRSQLTFHLKEARRKFHTHGTTQWLQFRKVYGEESYLDDPACTHFNIGTFNRCTSVALKYTLRMLLQEKWNNLRSPANPQNYLHGKVVPRGIDNEGNLMFQYAQHPYERRWTKEGIDLTR